jgi:hypothetical protein
MLPKGAKPNTVPPAHVLAKYSEVTGKAIQSAAKPGTVAAVYARWLEWARKEVKEGRLSRRTLADYEDHWKELLPVFGGGVMDALDQVVLLLYYDRRSSKDRAKREVNFLGMLSAWAKPRGMMRAENPVDRGLRHQMKVTSAKKPVVPPAIYQAVWACGDQLVRDTLDLSYMLATRPSEAIRVPMPDVGATELDKIMPKTSKRGRALVKVPITPAMHELIERRRAMCPHSLYVLFDDDGQQLRSNGAIRSRLYKARDLAKQVCEKAGIPWVDLTRQQLRPTAITQVDKDQGREGARKLAGHTTDKQTAHYVRPEVETAQAANRPDFDEALQAQIEAIKEQLQAAAVEKSFRHTL